MLNFLKSLFSFKGRIGRIYYLVSFAFFLAIIFSLIYLIESLPKGVSQSIAGIFSGILLFWIWIAITVKRCHDFGWSGLTFLWVFVPMANGILFLILPLLPGNKGPNEYGEPPK
jgi:uncharacterized membrane protein YhaH (DUF805 family)